MSEYQDSNDHFASHFNTGFDMLSPDQNDSSHVQHLEGQHNHNGTGQGGQLSQGTALALGDGDGLVEHSNNAGNLIIPLEFESNISNEGGPKHNSNSNSNYEDDKPHSRPRRTRARGEALDILKKEFNSNPNPTSQRRKKISEMTGLPEKNVRIWFQNRRAKYRKGDRRDQGKGVDSGSSGLSNYSNSDCLTFFDKIPLNINNNYYFIDICSITVGSWNRMKSGALRKDNLELIKDLSNLSPISINEIMSNATDLLVLISKKNFEVNYFFSAMANNTKILFRIFFPISSVTNCSLSLETDDIIESVNQQKGDEDDEADENSDKNEDHYHEELNKFAELKLTISRPPNFAVYFLDASDEAVKNQWSICDDFSEGRQVNDAFVGGSNIPHALKGSQASLKFMNSLILDYNSTNQIIPPPQPINARDSVIMEPQPLSLQHQQPQAFFDHFDATNDMLDIHRESPEIGETVGEENHHQGAHSTNLLSLPHEPHLPSIPDFFKNSTELTDDNRWL